MVTKGLLVRLEVKSGKDRWMEEFLVSSVPIVMQEAGTTAWFAIRFGRSEYGIFDVFPGDEDREAHLNGPVAKALIEQTDEMFSRPPRIQRLDVLADKIPAAAPDQADTKGLLLTFEAKSGREQQVERFLKDAQPIVQQEPETTAWFAIHLDDGHYGIFDVFPDNGGRFKHLVGKVPRQLAKSALSLLGSVPEMEMLNVIAEKLGGFATESPRFRIAAP
jgi:quinol monooxygenase YgiN